jgi:uncharacterized membrane protein
MPPEGILGLNLPRELIVVLIAMLPIFELRGALPVAINVFHFPWYYAFLLAVAGNLLPVPFLLLFLNSIARVLRRFAIFDRLLNWIFTRTRRKGQIVEKYERVGMAIFVGIPLPLTGAWTGAILAVLLGMKFKSAFLSITAGVLIAGVIVLCLSLLGWAGAIIAAVGLIALTVFGLWKI